MQTKKQIFNIIIQNFEYLQKEFKISRIGLFGSYVKNTAQEESDIDFIVEFSEPIGLKFIQLCDFLEKLFNKKVDVITADGLKSIRIQVITPDILKTVEYVDAA